jgi:predicted amidophosphoribosyltransferase
MHLPWEDVKRLVNQTSTTSGGQWSVVDALLNSGPSLRTLSEAQRKATAPGKFRVIPEAIPAIRGQRVFLVDDVITTGSTINACAEKLLAAGAKDVEVIAVARTNSISAGHTVHTAKKDSLFWDWDEPPF